jgi:capsid portal protein
MAKPVEGSSEKGLKGKHAVLVALCKARVLTGTSVDEVAAVQDIKDVEESWSEMGAIAPPYDAAALMSLYELSNSLRQNVDAYKENIEGFGHQFRPRIDLDAEGADDRIREAILLERYYEAVDEADEEEDRGVEVDRDNLEIDTEVSDTEVNDRMEELRGQIKQQMLIAQAWFQNCGDDMSFIDLRKEKRQDMEVIGHGAWEFRRDNRGRLRRINYVPGFTVYPVKDDGSRVEVEQKERVSPIGTRAFVNERFFRKYVQKVDGDKYPRYFKSLGDPRIVSRRTGKDFDDVKALEKAEGHDETAHEMKYFDVSSPRTPAGVPRWIGNLIAVMGSRAADEVNYLLFDHKSVPPGIFFVMGGKLGDQTKDKLREFISDELQGRDAFHKLMILELPMVEGRPGDKPMMPNIEWKSLMADQHTDASFSGYDKNNRDKLGSSFRQHPMLRGETVGEMNRAIAWAILEFTDQQVYGPERESFDWWINQNIMPEIGCNIIEFESNSPVTTNPELIAKVVDIIAKHGGLVPNEIREIASSVLNREYEAIDEDWAKKLPAILTLAGYQPGVTPGDEGDQPTPEEQAATIAALEMRLAQIGMEVAGLKNMDFSDLFPTVGDETTGDVETGGSEGDD